MVSQKPVVNDQDVDRTISTRKEQIVQMESGLVSAESEEQKAGKVNFCICKSYSTGCILHSYFSPLLIVAFLFVSLFVLSKWLINCSGAGAYSHCFKVFL